MKVRSFISLVLVVVVLVNSVSGPGCANIVPPQGGPRDSLPPVLIKANPVDSSLNFKEKRLTFTFDEYIDVQNVQQELLVSPIPRILPEVNYRLNTITVKISDSLEENTTYTYNFGKAIKDINEGNVMKDFTFTFSTGNYFDSLQLSGSVILAETGKVDTSLTVILHTNPDDSALVNEKPRYVTRLDNKGNFVFKNLPPKTFYVYAMKDDGGRRWSYDEKQLFAFAPNPVTVPQDTIPLTLYAYQASSTAATTRQSLPGVSAGGRGRLGGATAERRLRFSNNLVNNQLDLLNEFLISFDQPLKTFDSTKITLHTDSTFKPVTNYRFVLDSSRSQLQLLHTWKENTAYHLILDIDFAEDSSGRKLLKSDTLSFKTKKLSDYGSLKLRFRSLDISKNPVLLFVLNNNISRSFPLASPDFSASLLLPGEYELRILYDENKNGKWDPGDFFGGRKQPELVKPVERKINVKAGSENEFDISL